MVKGSVEQIWLLSSQDAPKATHKTTMDSPRSAKTIIAISVSISQIPVSQS